MCVTKGKGNDYGTDINRRGAMAGNGTALVPRIFGRLAHTAAAKQSKPMGDVVVEGGGEIMSMGISLACPQNDYTPNTSSRQILARAWEHVSSVEYKVSSRWLFYRLLQDGIYQKKGDYNKYLALMSRARHALYGPWKRNTLADDTRDIYAHPGGHADGAEWADTVKRYGVNCTIDHWTRQDTYVEVWFEAAAMASQFRHYTDDIPITLRPFQGMPSIDYKNRAAMDLSKAADKYDLPIVVLYFGDCDRAGHTIPETSIADIRDWCPYEFEYLRVGLNEGDGERYGIPEDFEHPGNYQWEALDDTTAGGIIRNALEKYVDLNAVKETEAEAVKAMAALKDYLQGFEYST